MLPHRTSIAWLLLALTNADYDSASMVQVSIDASHHAVQNLGIQDPEAAAVYAGPTPVPNNMVNSGANILSSGADQKEALSRRVCGADFAKHEGLCRWFSAHAANLTADIGPIYSSTSDDARKVMGSPSNKTINIQALILMALMAAGTLIGYCHGGRYWVLGMVISSYILLLPAVFYKDYAFYAAINVPSMGIPETLLTPEQLRVTITKFRDIPGPFRDSARSMVPRLWEHRCYLCAILVAVFAFLVPAVKIVLMVVAERCRHTKPDVCRRCYEVVQVCSKWAAPDLFAYGFLYTSTRRGHHPPLLESIQVLESGMTCYMLFIFGSTFSSCFISLPATMREPARSKPLLLQCFDGPFLPTLLLTCVWLPLFIVGLTYPITTLHVDVTAALNGNPEIAMSPEVFTSALKMLGIDLEMLLNNEVSFLANTFDIIRWFFENGELNLLILGIMLSFFTIILTALSMASLLWVAYMSRTPGREKNTRRPSMDGARETSLEIPFLLKHICLMDVCVAGIATGILSMKPHRQWGLTFSNGPALLVLVAAEVVHYITHYLVCNAVVYLEDGSSAQMTVKG